MFLAALDATQIVVALTAAGTLLAALVAVFKVRPERDRLSVSVAEGALKVQVTLVDEMEAALNRVRSDVIELRTEVDHLRLANLKLGTEVDSLTNELRIVTSERDRLHQENLDLRARVAHLERRVEELTRKKES